MSDMSNNHPPFALINEDKVKEVFVEGISQTMLGAPTSKLTFHTVVTYGENGVEVREPVIRLAIPTTALLEMCRNVLARAGENKDNIAVGYDFIKSVSLSMLNDISVSQAPILDRPKFDEP